MIFAGYGTKSDYNTGEITSQIQLWPQTHAFVVIRLPTAHGGSAAGPLPEAATGSSLEKSLGATGKERVMVANKDHGAWDNSPNDGVDFTHAFLATGRIEAEIAGYKEGQPSLQNMVCYLNRKGVLIKRVGLFIIADY